MLLLSSYFGNYNSHRTKTRTKTEPPLWRPPPPITDESLISGRADRTKTEPEPKLKPNLTQTEFQMHKLTRRCFVQRRRYGRAMNRAYQFSGVRHVRTCRRCAPSAYIES